jgi:hypothetical protein
VTAVTKHLISLAFFDRSAARSMRAGLIRNPGPCGTKTANG